MIYSTVTSLRWADAEEKLLDCVVEFEGLGAVPFTASADDPTPHTQDIFARALNGDFGPIAAYEPPTQTLDQVKAAEIAAIEAERAERQAQDFAWDFDGLTALDDYEHSAAAGVRYLQCRPLDIDNWMALYARADSLARRGYGAVTVPMRCEDNWNVQTTADQVIEVLDALFDRNAGLLFYAGRLKTQVRDATDVATVVAVRHAAEWPS